MSDGQDRRIIIDRANRMLKQSRSLRRMSEELLQESHDLKDESDDLRKSARGSAKAPMPKHGSQKKR